MTTDQDMAAPPADAEAAEVVEETFADQGIEPSGSEEVGAAQITDTAPPKEVEDADVDVVSFAKYRSGVAGPVPMGQCKQRGAIPSSRVNEYAQHLFSQGDAAMVYFFMKDGSMRMFIGQMELKQVNYAKGE